MKKCGSAAGIFVRSLRVASGLLLALGMVLGLSVAAHAVLPGDIVTVAGNGAAGFSGDNGVATTAMLNNPHEVAITSDGSFYIADYQNHRIRKIAATGIITTVAGNGTAGFSGDNGPATSASLNRPTGVAVDRDGNIFISDSDNYRIRKVNALTGIITTVAGSTLGFSGDNGPATSAQLRSPFGMAFDGSGNLYFSDGNNNCIRMVNATTGIITTVAGIGSVTGAFSGDNGLATSAALSHPRDIVFDNNGNIYIADYGNHRIRKVDAVTGIITTVAGNGTYGFSGDGGLAGSASFKDPYGLVFDSAGNLYVSDSINNRIRKIDAATGIITTVAGNGNSTFSGDNGPALSASLFTPWGMAIDSAGNLLIVDSQHNRIRKVYLNPVSTTVTTLTSSVPANASVYGTPVTFTVTVTSNDGIPGGTVTVMDGASPLGSVVLDESGQATFSTSFLSVGSHTITAVYGLAGIYNTSTSNGVIHNVNVPPVTPPTVSTDTVSAVTTTGVILNGWAGSNGAISSISFDYGLTTGYGSTVTAAQSPLAANAGGPVSAAISGLACGTSYHFRITGQNSAGTTTSPDATFTTTACPAPGSAIITTIAGNGEQTFAGDDDPGTSASLYYPYGVARDSAGNIYIADTFNYRIRKLEAGSGIIRTVAGVSTSGFSGDGGSATAAEINCPYGVTVDSAGNIYIADTYNNRIRRVDAITGIITTVAGNGTAAFSGDGGPAASAGINNPVAVAVDSAGNLYISDTNNNRIRRVDATTGIITTVAGNGSGSFSGDGGPATLASIHWPQGVTIDSDANLYIADYLNMRIRKVMAGSGIITTVAGNGTGTYVGNGGEGGLATSANLWEPHSVAVDGDGNLFIAESNSSRIRKVSAGTGIIATVAGNGNWDFGGDGGEAISASLKAPTSVVVDNAGNLYIADTSNHRIRTVFIATSSRVLLPQTGQSICLDGIGVEQPCVNMPGHDGAVRAGVEWPVPRFINNGDQTITDNLTGLQWTQNANAPATGSCTGGTNMAWNDALAYVACLNSSGYLGHSDWRMPNVNELFSMIDVSKYYSSASAWLAGQGFTNVIDGYHWSSTSYIFSPASAWGVAVTLGDTHVFEKTLPYAVWPVRGGAPGTGTVSLPATGQNICYDHNGAEISCAGSGQDGELKKGIADPVVRFMPNGNQTNTDTFTGLVWARDASVPTVGACTGGSEGKRWTAALDYINCLNSANYLGYSDWRMPNMQEMMSMYARGIESQARLWQVGFTISTTTTATSNTPVYWTSTSHAGPTGMAWTVSMYDGWVNGDYKDNFNYVWPVRGDTPPVITMSSTPVRFSNVASGTITFGANEFATLQCSLDNTAYTDCASPFSYSGLANGQHTFAVKATDTAGNVSAPVTHTWTINTALAESSAILVPQTGQTSCHDTTGAEIACEGTGQDGDNRAGTLWPSPRFTNNDNGTITDNLTGLGWMANVNIMATKDPSFDTDDVPGNGAVTWRNALNYIARLNSESYLGFSDWRLPNVTELASVINRDPAGNTAWLASYGFTNLIHSYYWSSTTVPGMPTDAYDVYIEDGDVLTYLKTSTGGYVWPVRGAGTLLTTGQTGCYADDGSALSCTDESAAGQDGAVRNGARWPEARFVDNGNSTFTDRNSGLIWLKDARIMASRDPQFDSDATAGDGDVTWRHALDYIKKLNQEAYLGYSDWRLPNANEFLSLADRQQADLANWLDAQIASATQGSTWWTATAFNPSALEACFYGISDGVIGCGGSKWDAFSVWPVRGGYVAPRLTVTKSGTGTISASTGALTWDAGTTKGVASYEMGANTIVTLTAAPGAGLSAIWAGCDTFSSTTCTVAMNAKRDVSATFADVTAPAVPTNIETQVPTMTGQLVTTWTKPDSADFSHIHIYRSTAAGTLGTLVGDGLTGIEFTDTGLASQTRYYYTVRSVDAAGNESSNTAQVSGTTLDATPPAAATGVTVSDAATGGKLNISWIRPTAADLASITLYRSTASGQLGTVAAASQTGTTYSDTGLTNGMRYYYIIRAFDTSGNYSDTAQYSAVPTAPVNGLCGSATTFNYTAAPAANLCTMGTPSSVSGNGPWSWTCSDLNGGTPATCTAAQAGGVVYRSNDSGVNWTPTKTGLAFNSGLSSLLVSPLYATDHTLFIGSSDGIHKSSDSGDSWSQVVSAYNVRAFAVSPAYASDRTIFAGAILNGVYKSTNGGTSWVSANTGLANQQVRSLAISPSYASDRTVFVGLLGQGSYKSTDNGATWIAANTGLAGLTPLALAVSPAYASDRTLFAVTTGGVYGNGGPDYHVYRSIDSGTTWTLSDTGLSGSMTTLGISPNYAVDQTLYVVTSSGVYKSSNKGVSWVLSNSSGTGNSISLSPAYASDQTLFAGIYGDNIYRSNNGGSSWSASNSGLAAGRQISSVTVSPTFGSDHTVFAASSLVGPSASVTSSLSFGNVGIGNTSSNRQVFLANAFPADVSLSIAGISLSGAGADQFSISAGSCGSLTPVVAVGSQCSLNVVFSPTSTGNKSATIQITTNDAMLPIAYVSLSGSGIFIDTVPPSAPTNIEVQTPTSKGQMTITWTNPADADLAHIHIYRSTAAGTLGTLVGDGLTGIKFTDTGLASQTRYYYTVRSVDTTGNESSNTAQVSGTTLDSTPPAAATGVSVTDAATGGKLDIGWIRPTATDLASITLYRSTISGQLGAVAATNQAGISYSDTGLTNGTVYYYTIRATDTSGNYSDTAQYNGTPTAPDTAPPGVISCSGTITQPLPLTGDKLQLNWTNPTDSDFAITRIYASTDSGLGTLIYQGTGTAYLHNGLTAGSTYNYTYRTVDTAGNETANTDYCSYTPVDQTAPACPTELNALRNTDGTVTLSWNRSASADIYSYQIYASDADAAVAYATPTATVISPAVTWSSGQLTQGKTYQFGIRTVDSLLISPNVSGNCGVISVAIPNPAPACDVSASIKVPQTGKKLGGNRTSVIAEVTSGSESNLASVRFQYRVSGIANSWLNVPSTDPVNFPNPDTVKPWFVHWDITGLTDNTDYDIRAVATCTNTALDTTPDYITVAVNKSDPDSDEDDTAGGEHRKTEKVGGAADSHIVKGDTADTRVTRLTLPAQSVPEGVRVTVTESNPASKAALVPGDHGNGGTFREISFDDGRHLLDNSKKAELTVPYKDDNNDGIVDGTTINVHDLQVCDYDNAGSTWNCLDSTVDTAAKTVKAKTATFSLFGLLAPPKPLVAGWNLVSVPLTPSPATAVSVFGAGAYFYNPATGAYPAASTIEAGKAYWVRNGFTSIRAAGTETPDSSFSIPIKRGWNLIGNPFRYKVNVNDLQIANGSTVAIAVAETNGWAVGTLFNYSNGSYQMSSHQDGGVLEPWKGYWILSDINGTLIVPNTPAH